MDESLLEGGVTFSGSKPLSMSPEGEITRSGAKALSLSPDDQIIKSGVKQLSMSPEGGVIKPASGSPLNYISKYLIQYVAASSPKNKPAKRVSGARVLTSKECVEILKEREEKKKKAEEEKEQRKIEREKRREQKELIKKEKEEKAKKAAKRDSRPKKRAPRSTNKSYVDKQSPNASSPGSAPRAKRKKPVSHDSDSDIGINKCCMCFQTFEDDEREQSGLEWVECACSRWLHEECIEYNLSVNSRGQELLCPFCCL